MVGINGVYYNYVLNSQYTHSNIPFNPEWVNNPPELNTEIWDTNFKIITFVLRVTDVEKWELDKLLNLATLVPIDDNIYDKFQYGFITSIDNTYEINENSSYPWKLIIEIVSIYESDRNFFGFEKIDDEHLFEEGFERIYPFG